jgi:hypothetical protein
MAGGAFIDLNESGKLELDLFFDFLCPFTFQTFLWLSDVKELMGAENVDLRLNFLSLAQINRKDENWNIWEQKPDNADAKGLLNFLAGAAILKSGGQEALQKFYKEYGLLIHRDKQEGNQATLEKAASSAGITTDVLKPVFSGDIADGLAKLKADHTVGATKYKAFASPTVVFEEEHPVFVKMMPRPSKDTALEVFQNVMSVAMVHPNVLEIKSTKSNEEIRALFNQAFAEEAVDYDYFELD